MIAKFTILLQDCYSKNADFTFFLCNRQPYTLLYIGAVDDVLKI